MRKIQIAISSDLCVQIDMKFDMQMRPATETSWVVSYGGKTIPRWRMAAILKIDISPYLSEQETQLSQRDRATLRVIEYFAKSLKITQGHSKLHCGVGRV